MPNATSVWDFSDGEILTAAKLDDVNCGIHVFANSTARTNAYGGTGERTLVEGEFSYLADTNATEYYDGSAWQTISQAPAMVLINTTTISAAATTNVNSVFSATYQNYYINFTMSNISTTDMRTGFRLRAAGTDATANYNSQRVGGYQSTTFSESDPMGTDEWFFVQGNSGTPTNSAVNFWIYNPFDATPTKFISQSFDRSSSIGLIVANNMGHNTNATSYDGFTLQTATGTISGTLRIYGLRNSV